MALHRIHVDFHFFCALFCECLIILYYKKIYFGVLRVATVEACCITFQCDVFPDTIHKEESEESRRERGVGVGRRQRVAFCAQEEFRQGQSPALGLRKVLAEDHLAYTCDIIVIINM